LEDNIKMVLKETEWEGRNWFDVAQDRVQCQVLVNMEIKLQVPQNVRNFLTS
jgi:hypothetical protein